MKNKKDLICKLIVFGCLLTVVCVTMLYESVHKDVLWTEKLYTSNKTHRIGLVTLSLYYPTGDTIIDDTMNCLSTNKERYADLHDLEYFDGVQFKENRDLLLPYNPWMNLADLRWSKIQYLEYLFRFSLESKGIEWFLWIDSDVLFTNMDVPPQDRLNLYLEEYKLKNGPDSTPPTLIVTRDHNAVNIGVFFIRVSPDGLALLQRIWSTPVSPKDRDWADNMAFIKAMKQDTYLKKQVFIIPYQQQRILQSYYNPDYLNSMWKDGDWIVHFAGYGIIATSGRVKATFQFICNEL